MNAPTRCVLQAIFERLELWDGVIACHQALDQDDRAEALVRERLTANESPDLWCVLGDLKRDVSFFDKAWELSGGKHTRSMRSKGFFLLRQARRAGPLPHGVPRARFGCRA
jgi:hypothetical protein